MQSKGAFEMRKLYKKQKGFTIIETMIVLAVAGLIMLIVFLAVPALQRSSRNTQRKNDAGNIVSAITTYTTNNNGTLPLSEVNVLSAINGVKLGYYTTSDIYLYGSGVIMGGSATNTPAINGISEPTPCSTVGTTGGCTSSASEVNTEDVIYMPSYTCNSSTNQPQPGSSRGFAIVYEVETGSNTAQEQCTAS